MADQCIDIATRRDCAAPAPIRRRPTGDVDQDYYHARARQAQAQAFRDAAEVIGAFLGRQRRAAARALGAWYARRRTYRVLSALDDRALRDIGISRSEIRAVSQGIWLPAGRERLTSGAVPAAAETVHPTDWNDQAPRTAA